MGQYLLEWFGADYNAIDIKAAYFGDFDEINKNY